VSGMLFAFRCVDSVVQTLLIESINLEAPARSFEDPFEIQIIVFVDNCDVETAGLVGCSLAILK